jgi:hypothetical protein
LRACEEREGRYYVSVVCEEANRLWSGTTTTG